MTQEALAGVWLPGLDPGRRQFVQLSGEARRYRARGRRSAPRGHRRLRDVGCAERGAEQWNLGAPCAHGRLPCDRPGRARPRDIRLVGRSHRARSGDRHGSLLRRVPERTRRLPRHDRTFFAWSGRGALRLAQFPVITIRDQVGVEVGLADALGIASWACVIGGSMGGMRVLEWCVGYPERVRRAVVLAVGAAATADQIALCSLQIRAIRQDPAFAGGDYYGTGAPPGRWPRDCARDRPGELSDRRRNSRAASVDGRRPRKIPSRAVAMPWSPISSITGTNWRRASTPIPTSS